MSPQVDQRKIVSIQLLRALAASVVAIVHIGWAFAESIGDGLGIGPIPERAAQSAVLLFFLVSGFIMVVSSRDLFGAKGGARRFFVRRLVRIMPPYWIATLFLLATLGLLFAQTFSMGEIGLSLALIPYWPSEGAEAVNDLAIPILWPGWTLFFELLFYLLFGLAIGAGKRAAILFASLGCVALTLAGQFVSNETAVLFTMTRPVVLVFVVGMIVALRVESGRSIPVAVRLALLALGVLAWVVVPNPDGAPALGFQYLLWAGLPALLVFIAAVGGPLRLPSEPLINRAGDMSYALYLLHIPIGWVSLWLYGKVQFFAGAWGYFLGALTACFVVSWLFFAYVERPLTGWLNHALGATKA